LNAICLFQAKLAILEQKLLHEEHERKLVQVKADEVSPHTLHFFNQLNKFAPFFAQKAEQVSNSLKKMQS